MKGLFKLIAGVTLSLAITQTIFGEVEIKEGAPTDFIVKAQSLDGNQFNLNFDIKEEGHFKLIEDADAMLDVDAREEAYRAGETEEYNRFITDKDTDIIKGGGQVDQQLLAKTLLEICTGCLPVEEISQLVMKEHTVKVIKDQDKQILEDDRGNYIEIPLIFSIRYRKSGIWGGMTTQGKLSVLGKLKYYFEQSIEDKNVSIVLEKYGNHENGSWILPKLGLSDHRKFDNATFINLVSLPILYDYFYQESHLMKFLNIAGYSQKEIQEMKEINSPKMVRD